MKPRFELAHELDQVARLADTRPSSSSIFAQRLFELSFERTRIRYARCSACTVSFEKPFALQADRVDAVLRLSRRLPTVFT